MLYLFDGVINGNQKHSIYKYIGDKTNLIDYVPYMQMPILQADGDELQYILETMKNIPYTNKPDQVWTGDHARFICYNWRN